MKIPEIGDMIIYNGYIPDNIGNYDKEFIRDRLVVGEQYKVICSKKSSSTFIDWICVNYREIEVWAPIDCFDIKINKIHIKEKYDLR